MNPSMLIFSFALCASVVYCQPCAAGEYWSSSACKKCPPGTYGQTGTECVACPAGTFQPAFGAVAVDLCRFCYPNTYQPSAGSAKCLPCVDGTGSNRGATRCSRCAPGTRLKPVGDGCIACERGSYSEVFNSDWCESCGDGRTSPPKANSSSMCRRCWRKESCYECDVNEYSPVSSSYCFACPDGFVSERGARSLAECKPCPKNTYRTSYWRRCFPCATGTFTFGEGAARCRKEGQKCFTKFRQAVNGDCISCPHGWRWVPHRKVCRPCPKGMVRDSFDIGTKCVKCKGDTFIGENRISCVCPVGHYRKEWKCIPCAKGFWSSTQSPGGTCNPCGRTNNGWYNDEEGQAYCKLCIGGVPNKEGTKCEQCPAGLMPNILDESDIDQRLRRRRIGHTRCVLPTTRCPPGFDERVTVGASNRFSRCRNSTTGATIAI